MKVALVCATILAMMALGVAVWMGIKDRGAAHQLAHAEQQAGTATVAAGQAKAETDATRIVVSGEARNHLDIEVHQHNAASIQAAPGADAPVDPRLNDVGRRGLCQFSSYRDDPQCARLRGADPAQLPSAGEGRPAPF